MKVIGKINSGIYICEVSHNEIAKYMDLYYCNRKMENLEVGDIIDLGKGHDFAQETREAMRKTSAFIEANKEIIKTIMDGISIVGN